MNLRHEIEKLAFELYERDGRIPGRDMEHWLEAERIVNLRYGVSFDDKSAGSRKSTAKAPDKKTASKWSKPSARR
ncbi:MAG TPA: DUF2934 domain-containing protein [Desulfomonilia bacterium]|nr:DUF2934 domain-containing protein [Desulfomonilia bacterium]